MEVKKNTVLITGGGSGIGRSLASAFVQNGSNVIICGRDERKLEIAKELTPELHTKVCDVTSEEQRQALFEWVKEYFPALNMLINNAGVMRIVDLTQIDASDSRVSQEVEINLVSPIKLSLMFLPLLTTQPQAAVVNISSGFAYVPDAGTPIYCATKAAIHSFSQSLRYQLRNTPVEVFEVLPPGVDTDLNSEGNFDKISPDKVAEVVLKEMVKGTTEIRIGQANPLFYGSRIAPSFIHGMLNNQISKARVSSK
jgi:uncharacterized oxidoreductase